MSEYTALSITSKVWMANASGARQRIHQLDYGTRPHLLPFYARTDLVLGRFHHRSHSVSVPRPIPFFALSPCTGPYPARLGSLAAEPTLEVRTGVPRTSIGLHLGLCRDAEHIVLGAADSTTWSLGFSSMSWLGLLYVFGVRC